MNNVVLIGRLTRDPEIRYKSESSNAMCTFTLAVDKNLSKDRRREMEARGQATADFIRIVTWGRTAELCGNYLAKGRMTAVQGRIQTGSYVNQQGQRVYTTDVVADRVEFLEWGENRAPQSGNMNSQGGFDSPYNDPVNRSGYDQMPNNQVPNNDVGGFDDDEDDFIPFDDDSKIPF
ncbi:MAG: single-stranded DNA-binding protein [Tissierellia bacterium]|nr:single-stranded DNA-binding protein [Tissierellia bacterium]